MSYPILLRQSCQFCHAKQTVEVQNSEEFKRAALSWFRAHRRCAKGQDIRLDATSGETPDTATRPIATALLRGGG